MKEMLDRMAKDLARIRKNKPLIHHITNYVVMNETANATLCIGALPIMAHAKEEVEEMVVAAGALLLNIGTLAPELVDSMILAAKKANELGIPVVLDPVGAGATALRTSASTRLFAETKVDIVRGNIAEICALIGRRAEIKGVEALSDLEGAEEVAKEMSKTKGCTTAITGKIDIVSDGTRIALIENGHSMLRTVTGTGCMATTIVAAFAAAEEDRFLAATGGLIAFGIAGEKAAQISGPRPGTFHVCLYDALAELSEEELLSRARVRFI